MTPYTIHSQLLGPWENFSHILEDCASKKSIVFDPAWDAQAISNRLAALDLTLEAIWLTHTHTDHVNALAELLSIHPVPVYASAEEIAFLKNFPKGQPPFGSIPEETIALNDQELLTLGATKVKAITTPGHTAGGLCFLLADDLITGDTLFIDGCGRADLPGANPETLYHSLRKIVDTVPHHVTLHTGHAYGPTPTATLAQQITTNPYLRRTNLEDFLHYRMG